MNQGHLPLLLHRLGYIVLLSWLLAPTALCGGTATAVSLSAEKRDSTVILVGDLQRTNFWELVLFREQNDDAREEILHQIAEEDPALVIMLGDLVSWGDSRDDWDRFAEAEKPLMEKHIHTLPVLGNHEYFGNNNGALSLFFEHFPEPHRSLWRTARLHNMAFILLNSNFDDMSEQEIDEQNRWYQEQLDRYDQDSTVSLVVVCSHHPPYTNSTIVSPSTDVQRYFVKPFLASRKAEVYFSGHCHAYEHFQEGGKQFIVSGGGGGPRQRLEVNESRCTYKDLFRGASIRDFHFCRLIPDGNTVLLQMVMVNPRLKQWSIGDELRIPLQKNQLVHN